ncbi:MAG: hydroxylase [Betaproteobacteria bacterium RIFCSPHIGHO2_12_FULL_69_13]|nr:MAG: hydroxylase [Betaproteobacteria bacterium RIFCSPHIGHO2_12_FULL_69_13]OGA65754.1 MAG: hydroxylase [Betaproteobacteria bacterium RIFCSPLOWO2_12_FULL_68_20]
MRITIDTDRKTVSVGEGAGAQSHPLYAKRAFELVSDLWLRLSWVQKYSYTFTWMGRPIIQHPEDLVRLQEVIYFLKPDVIIETGIAHGGSLVLSASLMKAMGRGRVVVGVDIEIRPHNRGAIEAHELFPMIRLIEGDSTAPEVVARAASHVRPGDKVLVILDSNHSLEHVRKELEAYHRLVTPGSYIVATDGIMRDLWDAPRGEAGWKTDNPAQAAREFVAAHPDFAIEQPAWRFNESALDKVITGWPDAWIRRRG